MRYDDEIKAIIAESRTLDADTKRLVWSLHRTTPDACQRRAQARHERLMADNEAYRRNRTQHRQFLRELEAEEHSASQLASGVARYPVERRVGRLNERHQTLLGKMRRDVQLTFGPFEGFGPGDMVMLELLRETIRPAIERADIADLLRRARRALDVRDPRAQVEFELIEDRIAAGRLAQNADDLPLVRELTEVVGIAQDVRIPEALESVSAVIAAAQAAVSRAQLVSILPVNPEHAANLSAKQAFENEQQEYVAALEAEKQSKAEAAAGAGA